jgi:hypothetical protein
MTITGALPYILVAIVLILFISAFSTDWKGGRR